jgi:hypothetical protein
MAAQFDLHFYELVQEYNNIHEYLSGEAWPNGSKGPETNAEWVRVKRYIGLMESLNRLRKDGLMSMEQIDESYSHRIFRILQNPSIREKCFNEEAFAWSTFMELADALDSQKVYRGLIQERQAQIVARENGSELLHPISAQGRRNGERKQGRGG